MHNLNECAFHCQGVKNTSANGMPTRTREWAAVARRFAGKMANWVGRILDGGIEHWADPRQILLGQINTNHDGRGVYFMDPAGHGLEIISRPYDSAA